MIGAPRRGTRSCSSSDTPLRPAAKHDTRSVPRVTKCSVHARAGLHAVEEAQAQVGGRHAQREQTHVRVQVPLLLPLLLLLLSALMWLLALLLLLLLCLYER